MKHIKWLNIGFSAEYCVSNIYFWFYERLIEPWKSNDPHEITLLRNNSERWTNLVIKWTILRLDKTQSITLQLNFKPTSMLYMLSKCMHIQCRLYHSYFGYKNETKFHFNPVNSIMITKSFEYQASCRPSSFKLNFKNGLQSDKITLFGKCQQFCLHFQLQCWFYVNFWRLSIFFSGVQNVCRNITRRMKQQIWIIISLPEGFWNALDL